jgi:hypothetical protein
VVGVTKPGANAYATIAAATNGSVSALGALHCDVECAAPYRVAEIDIA